MKRDLRGIKPTQYQLNHCFSFVELVANLYHPYYPITEKVYHRLMNQKNFPNDVVLYQGKLCTFGGADSGYALMPIINKEKLVDTTRDYYSN